MSFSERLELQYSAEQKYKQVMNLSAAGPFIFLKPSYSWWDSVVHDVRTMSAAREYTEKKANNLKYWCTKKTTKNIG